MQENYNKSSYSVSRTHLRMPNHGLTSCVRKDPALSLL